MQMNRQVWVAIAIDGNTPALAPTLTTVNLGIVELISLIPNIQMTRCLRLIIAATEEEANRELHGRRERAKPAEGKATGDGNELAKSLMDMLRIAAGEVEPAGEVE